MTVYIRTNDSLNPIYSKKDPEEYSIGELLDYLESIAEHFPDANECDCHICNIHASICHFATKIGTIVRRSAE